MKNSLAVLLFVLPGILCAQTEGQTGIRFDNSISWNAIKAKAKEENKYIFVDCFATWCGPCKKMDKEVYPVDSIGKLFSDNFLSVKVQMDSTAKDNEDVKAWYADARQLQDEYKIAAFPTFLFLSPDGKLVHRSMGYIDPRGFASLAHDALNPNKQYYTLMETYRQGKMAYSDMPGLAITARSFRDAGFADTVAKNYINNYLLKLDDTALYTRKNLGFITDFTRSSTDKTFKMFYTRANRIDTVMKTKNLSQNLVDVIIEQEEINNILYKDGKPATDNPDWKKIQTNIKKRYNDPYADRIVLWSKIKWYERRKDWPEYCKNVILKVEKYGPYDKVFYYIQQPTASLWNFSAWEIFMYGTDKAQLEKALEWSGQAIKTSIKPDGEFFDTYANILYKLGRKEEALSYEQKAIELNPMAPDIKENLEKIQKGEPTWATK